MHTAAYMGLSQTICIHVTVYVWARIAWCTDIQHSLPPALLKSPFCCLEMFFCVHLQEGAAALDYLE